MLIVSPSSRMVKFLYFFSLLRFFRREIRERRATDLCLLHGRANDDLPIVDVLPVALRVDKKK